MSKLFLIFGLIAVAVGFGFVPLAIQGIVDTPSVKIFPQMTFVVGVITFILVGVLLIGLGRVFLILDRIEKGRP